MDKINRVAANLGLDEPTAIEGSAQGRIRRQRPGLRTRKKKCLGGRRKHLKRLDPTMEIQGFPWLGGRSPAHRQKQRQNCGEASRSEGETAVGSLYPWQPPAHLAATCALPTSTTATAVILSSVQDEPQSIAPCDMPRSEHCRIRGNCLTVSPCLPWRKLRSLAELLLLVELLSPGAERLALVERPGVGLLIGAGEASRRAVEGRQRADRQCCPPWASARSSRMLWSTTWRRRGARPSDPDKLPGGRPSDERSAIMRAVPWKDSKPEMIVRCALHRLGYRFRLHRPTLSAPVAKSHSRIVSS